jgi:hypothetical protein
MCAKEFEMAYKEWWIPPNGARMNITKISEAPGTFRCHVTQIMVRIGYSMNLALNQEDMAI